MKKFKLINICLIFTIILNLNFYVFADDELEETSVSKEDIEQFITTQADLMKEPIINSRNAIVYDRISRQNFIWQRGE